MKIAFISDIHGNVYALKAVLEDIEKRGILSSNIYSLGDLVGYGTRPNEVINLIKSKNIVSVMGNHDMSAAFNDINDTKKVLDAPLKWTINELSDDSKNYLRNLPKSLSIRVCDKSILLNHGSPTSITDYVFEHDLEKQENLTHVIKEDIIVFGHTHLQYHKTVNEKLFINAGSVGRPKDDDNRACYAILNLNDELKVEFVRIPYDFETLAKEIENTDLPDSYAQVIRTGKA